MAHFFEKKNRHVIPNWRSFENTAKLGELNGSNGIRIETTFKPDLTDLFTDWKNKPSLGVAGDLLGVAISCDEFSDDRLKDVVKYILSDDNAPQTLVEAAHSIGAERKEQVDYKFELENIRVFRIKKLEELYSKIHFYKLKLVENPHNSIAWVELARLYAINGQDKKAERAIKNALNLAPENRFVLRNMARFFVHDNQIDVAHDIIRKSSVVKYDPWIMATEIALADMRGRGSRFIKAGLQLIDSNSFHPFNTSELSSSIATIEYSNASTKKGRKLIEKSLIHPNDNALAQAEWVSNEQGGISIDPKKFNLINSFEAKARDYAQNEDWKNALENSKKWFLDLPFSKGAVIFGNEIASSKLKDHNLAASVAKIGLVSHPNDPLLLNNIAYSLSLIGGVEEAEEYLDKVRPDDLKNIEDLICITATHGLIAFRKGQHELGREFYLHSMELSKDANKTILNNIAFVNYVREEIIAGDEDVTNLMNRISKIKVNTQNQSLSDLIADVETIYNEKKLD